LTHHTGRSTTLPLPDYIDKNAHLDTKNMAKERNAVNLGTGNEGLSFRLFEIEMPHNGHKYIAYVGQQLSPSLSLPTSSGMAEYKARHKVAGHHYAYIVEAKSPTNGQLKNYHVLMRQNV
jgi:hypothetical protein